MPFCFFLESIPSAKLYTEQYLYFEKSNTIPEDWGELLSLERSSNSWKYLEWFKWRTFCVSPDRTLRDDCRELSHLEFRPGLERSSWGRSLSAWSSPPCGCCCQDSCWCRSQYPPGPTSCQVHLKVKSLVFDYRQDLIPSGSLSMEWVETFLMTLYFLPICSCCLSNLCSFRSKRQARKVCDDDQTRKLRTK